MEMQSVPLEYRDRIQRTFAALQKRGVECIYVPDRKAALEWLQQRLPAGDAIAHGSSTTLSEIGFVDLLKNEEAPYRYLNAEWQRENDATARYRLRAKLSLTANWYLGSVQAICETGQVVGSDASGSRQAFYIFGPPRVIWVAGVNKLVPSLEEGFRRVHEVALPREDQRMKNQGASGSYVGKLVVYEREKPGRISLLLVGESLGF